MIYYFYRYNIMKNITIKKIKQYLNRFNKNKTNKLLKNVNTKVQFENLVLKSNYMQDKKRSFKKYIDIDTTITDQEKSGRCWMFAALNVLRLDMIKKHKLDNFEFSENYLIFFDKLEKTKFFIDFIVKNKTTNINDLKLLNILTRGQTDGGRWSLFKSLIEKYGIIPKSNMSDHFHSKNTKEFNDFYNTYLIKIAYKIRNHKGDINELLDEILYNSYRILIIFLGEPPQTINWEYYKNVNKKKVYKSINNITPLNFYKKFVSHNVTNKVCLINYPCKTVPFYKLYNVELSFSVDDKFDEYINIPIEKMVDLVKKSIDNNTAVWCGIDTKKYISREEGFLDEKGFNYLNVFDENITLDDKCDSLEYRQSAPNHAIIIRGYNFDGKTNGFLVENSWGEKKGYKGNYYMSLDWFKKYTYKIVIDKKFLSNKEINVLKQKPVLLPYYSPFGNLLNNN